MDAEQRRLATERMAAWGEEYLRSTRNSCERAGQFFRDKDFFSAYLYLFVAFNNLYRLLVGFDGEEKAKIRDVIEKVPTEAIDCFYTCEYVDLINALNEGTPEQFKFEPEIDLTLNGITGLRSYFLGKEPRQCVAHVAQVVAMSTDSAEEKRMTLQSVAAELLYTIRNNQFHAVKGPQSAADLATLKVAYRVLKPVVDELLLVGDVAVRSGSAGQG